MNKAISLEITEMDKGPNVFMSIEAPDWALDGGFPEDLETVRLEDLVAEAVKVADWIYPANATDGPYDIYRTSNGVNVRVLSE